MDKLRAIEVFVEIAGQGSLTAAANTLDTSLPTVVRTLAALEKHLGVRLFNRTTRRLRLTDEGRQYLERCKRVMAELREAEAALSERNLQPSGRLTITASVMFGRIYIGPLLNGFLQRYPEVSAELLLLDRNVDLIEDGIDVGIRIGDLPDSTLVGAPVGEVRRVVCASPDYLERAGIPRRPLDIGSHESIHFSGLSSGREWSFRVQGKTMAVGIAPRFFTNQIDAAIDACRAGFGLGRFLSYQVQPWVEADELHLVLTEFEMPAIPVTVIYPHAKLMSARVRAFVDWISPCLRERLRRGGY